MCDTPSADKKLELLHDHYKESFAHIQETLRTRDRLFFAIVALLTISAFQLFSPSEAPGILASWLKTKLELSAEPDIEFLGSALWFLILGVSLRYFQAVVHAERSYEYIHGLEASLAKHWDGSPFTREGEAYNSDYPTFSCMMHWLYQLVFPLTFLGILIARIKSDWSLAGVTGPNIFNSSIFLVIVAGTILYLLKLHGKSPKAEQDAAPQI